MNLVQNLKLRINNIKRVLNREYGTLFILDRAIENIEKIEKEKVYMKQLLKDAEKSQKDISKLKRKKNIKNKDLTLEIREKEKLIAEQLKDIKKDIEEHTNYLKQFEGPSLEKLIRLKKFIESKCGMPLTENHRNIFLQIPNLTKTDIKLFEMYFEEYNEKISLENNSKEKRKNKNIFTLIKNKQKTKIVTTIEDNNNLDNIETKIENIVPIVTTDEIIEENNFINEKSLLLFQNFEAGNNFDSFKELFPKIENGSYYDIKNNLINLLNEKINLLYELSEKNSTDFTHLNTIKQFEDNLNEVYDYFDLQENELEDTYIEEKSAINIYFSLTPSGKPYIYDDINEIEDEIKPSLLKLITKLEQGRFTTNERQQRKLRNNNKLKDLFELKAPGIRLVYKSLGHNNYLVLMAFRKKTTREEKIVQSIFNRDTLCLKQTDYLKSIILNEQLIEQEIIIHEEIKNETKKQLTFTKRV